ncbi:extensin family protein [Aestuariimicrobium ganziense]|uniref:extensin family protein n=1 Tax=Aestuariimicrobium ganziense TaxID=2773677 RepID=UPI001944BF5B|nr:extensin family protein [Aestuariimicrobium ganziense]
MTVPLPPAVVPSEPPAPQRVSRRGLVLGTAGFGLGVLGGAAVLRRMADQAGPGVPWPTEGGDPAEREQAECVDASSLLRTDTIGSARLVYEVNGRASSMGFDPGFHRQLTTWLADWNTTSRYRGVRDLWSYGAHVNKDGCRSWHASGRAFDISRLRAGDNLLVSCRTDLWHEVSPARRTDLTRRYWTLAASLHLHFAYVLTHHFDARHDNHIHVDNSVSGSGMSRFTTRSRVQNQAVQAICASIWGRGGDVTGEWNDARRQVTPVLDDLGLGNLTKQETWQRFLRASVARG